ncbi:hypothetical protein N9B25_00980, partial [bacterium]|nr:hypothetical protein [bacterium]
CVDLVEGGYFNPSQALSALDRNLVSCTPITQQGVETEFMSMSQVLDVLPLQTIFNRPFGELAMEVGYLNRLELGR